MATMDIALAWNTIERALSMQRENADPVPDEETMLEAAHVLELKQLGHIISEWFFENFRRHLQENIVPVFWGKFQRPIPSTEVVQCVCEAVDNLYTQLAAYSPSFERLSTIQTLLQPDIPGGYRTHVTRAKANAQLLLKAVVFSHTTRHFQDALHEFYFRASKSFDSSNLDDLDESNEEEPLRCAGCEEERESCHCKTNISGFHKVNKQLSELGLLERLSGGPVSALTHQRIRHHVEHHCKGNFETPYLSQMEQWLDTKVVGWLEVIYGSGSDSSTSESVPHRTPSPILPNPEDTVPVARLQLTPSPTKQASSPCSSMDGSMKSTPGPTECEARDGSKESEQVVGYATVEQERNSVVAAHKGRLYHFLYTVYADTRIEQLFNIIVEYPDSEPALVDLRVCLEKTDRRSKLVVMLKNALETRLLHPGVNTGDILTAYVSAIRALRVLDHTGVLLELVCEPVRKYLRSREDTVRRIVSDLTGDSGNELSEELVKGQPLVLDNSYHSDEDASNWESWQPDPIDADPSRVSASRRSSDIISMLVNIYGSKELFVNEYRTLLADRLLAHFHSATEREIRNLELLKLRFGEQQLHYCEVMLKDVADSKRINTHIADRQRRDERRRLEGKGPEEEDENEEDKVDENQPETPMASTASAACRTVAVGTQTPGPSRPLDTTPVLASPIPGPSTSIHPTNAPRRPAARQLMPRVPLPSQPGGTDHLSNMNNTPAPPLLPPPLPPQFRPEPRPTTAPTSPLLVTPSTGIASTQTPAAGPSTAGASTDEQAPTVSVPRQEGTSTAPELGSNDKNSESTTEEKETPKEKSENDKPDPSNIENQNESKEEEIPVTAMILSAQFWPTFREEKLQLPEVMQFALDKYTKAYETLKGNRTLCWKNHLGLVSVEIELKDGRQLDFNVSPIHATIIWHFQHKSRWTVEELSSAMHMPTSGIRRKMALWQSHGLLREESTDTFVLCEDNRGRGSADVIMDEDEAESAMASASDQREEELQVLWSYIVGMLTNLESLPLERIHSMLKMFMLQSPTSSEVPLPELKAYLDRQVRDQRLVYSSGVYRLPKPGS